MGSKHHPQFSEQRIRNIRVRPRVKAGGEDELIARVEAHDQIQRDPHRPAGIQLRLDATERRRGVLNPGIRHQAIASATLPAGPRGEVREGLKPGAEGFPPKLRPALDHEREHVVHEVVDVILPDTGSSGEALKTPRVA